LSKKEYRRKGRRFGFTPNRKKRKCLCALLGEKLGWKDHIRYWERGGKLEKEKGNVTQKERPEAAYFRYRKGG